jgi:hypothetical protein
MVYRFVVNIFSPIYADYGQASINAGSKWGSGSVTIILQPDFTISFANSGPSFGSLLRTATTGRLVFTWTNDAQVYAWGSPRTVLGINGFLTSLVSSASDSRQRIEDTGVRPTASALPLILQLALLEDVPVASQGDLMMYGWTPGPPVVVPAIFYCMMQALEETREIETIVVFKSRADYLAEDEAGMYREQERLDSKTLERIRGLGSRTKKDRTRYVTPSGGLFLGWLAGEWMW